MRTAKVQQYLAHFAEQRTISYAKYLVARMRRVSQGTKDVKNCAYTDFAACWPHMFHSWMIGGSKHETEADFLYALGYLLRTKIDTHTQRFQYVTAAAAAGSGTVAGSCHGCARCSPEDTGASRDVKRTGCLTHC